jgi:hypothetical protein
MVRARGFLQSELVGHRLSFTLASALGATVPGLAGADGGDRREARSHPFCGAAWTGFQGILFSLGGRALVFIVLQHLLEFVPSLPSGVRVQLARN